MNGMFVTIVGLFSRRVALSAPPASVRRGALLYSAFANWLLTALAVKGPPHHPGDGVVRSRRRI